MTGFELHAWRIRIRALENLELSCLLTVALRSVTGMALREMSCVRRERTSCGGCPEQEDCVYSRLVEPAGKGQSPGVTDVAPPPLVMAPEARTLDDAPIRLSKGATIDVRAVFMGGARVHASLWLTALRSGLARGVGKERRALEVVDAQPLDVTFCAAGKKAEIELWTPLRLKSQGKIRSRFEAGDFVQGLMHRVTLLSETYRLTRPAGFSEDSVRLKHCDGRVIHVRRWSGRQKASMNLPGLTGTLVLEGELEGLWPWLALGEWVQMGKGTSMGFGRYRLRAIG